MEINFKYSEKALNVIRACPCGRKWNKNKKVWVVDENIDNFSFLLANKDVFPLNSTQIEFMRSEIAKWNVKMDVKIEYDVNWNCTPYQHQKNGLNLLMNNNACALFWEQGVGKTLPTIKSIELRVKDGHQRALIICPKTVLASWEKQIQEFSPNLSVVVVEGTRKKRDDILKKDKNVFLINYDQLRIMKNELIDKNFSIIVFDESQYLKNYKSIRSKIAYKMCQNIDVRILLTGTPIGKGAEDLFSQFKILDEVIFGKSFYAFRSQYFVSLNPHYPDWHLKESSVELLRKKMELRSQRLKKSDVLDLPDKIFQVLYFEMDSNQKKIYKEMKLKMVTMIENEVVQVNLAISKLMKLNQIASGFYINEDSTLNINNDKVNELKKIVASNPDEKITVWVAFTYDINKIKQEFPNALVISGQIKQEDRKKAIDEFQNNPDKKMIILQIQAGATGITLTASSLVVYYSRNYNLLDRLQSEDRNHRIGTKKAVTYIDLIAKDTIEEDILENLNKKRQVAFNLLDNNSWVKELIYKIKGE